jgi:DNA-binding Xre family transcriptional regulator
MLAMIRVTIREQAERRGILKPYQLAKELGIGQSKAARLWEGEKLPKLETLDLICSKWGCDLCALVTFAGKPPSIRKQNGKRR